MGTSSSVSGDNDGEMTSSKKEYTSCEQTNVDNITEDFNRAAIDDKSTCAECGKEGDRDKMNTCNKCKSVKYCNAACKKKHRKKHKKACEKRVAELHEEALFKDPPPPEECPICMLPLSNEHKTSIYYTCCGKTICDGCIYALRESEGGDRLCPFCRTPDEPTDEGTVKQIKKLMDKGNGEAFNLLAGLYTRGMYGIRINLTKANELYLKAGELGHAQAYHNLGNSYYHGTAVDVDMKKAKHYYELAAINGDIDARHFLGVLEGRNKNPRVAFKHFMIAAKMGHSKALEKVKRGYIMGLGLMVTKDEYTDTLRAYQERKNEIKSDMRAKAVASGLFENIYEG